MRPGTQSGNLFEPPSLCMSFRHPTKAVFCPTRTFASTASGLGCFETSRSRTLGFRLGCFPLPRQRHRKVAMQRGAVGVQFQRRAIAIHRLIKLPFGH